MWAIFTYSILYVFFLIIIIIIKSSAVPCQLHLKEVLQKRFMVREMATTSC